MLTSTRSARPRAAAARRVRASSAPGILYPLDFVYARAGVAPPSVKRVAPPDIPEPYRSLLVHESDMTITLERHFGGRVTLRPLSTFTVGGSYFRRVLLAQEYSGRPVEMGAIRMKLDVFSPRIRAQIHANEVPLGRILRDGGVDFKSVAKVFLRNHPEPRDDGRVLDARGAHALRTSNGSNPPRRQDRRHRGSASTRLTIKTMQQQTDPDVVVIGGGPAGSTVSTLLAQHGHRVELFEREKFPRFHIGESLIPETYWVLQRLNMLPKMKASHFVKKHSVQFVNAAGKESAPFYFYDNKPHECSQTWQVIRSEFDQMMLDNAREHGVKAVRGGARTGSALRGRARRRREDPRHGGRLGARSAREGRRRRQRPGARCCRTASSCGSGIRC